MAIPDINIRVDDLSDGQVINLLQEHRKEMLKHSPPEHVHALDVNAMKQPTLTFWRADWGQRIAGCAAFKQLDDTHAELKSMKVTDAVKGRGVGRLLLNHMLSVAKQRGYQRVSLETGTMDAFMPARTLYHSVGFEICEPFDKYVYDKHSVCMSLKID